MLGLPYKRSLWHRALASSSVIFLLLMIATFSSTKVSADNGITAGVEEEQLTREVPHPEMAGDETNDMKSVHTLGNGLDGKKREEGNTSGGETSVATGGAMDSQDVTVESQQSQKKGVHMVENERDKNQSFDGPSLQRPGVLPYQKNDGNDVFVDYGEGDSLAVLGANDAARSGDDDDDDNDDNDAGDADPDGKEKGYNHHSAAISDHVKGEKNKDVPAGTGFDPFIFRTLSGEELSKLYHRAISALYKEGDFAAALSWIKEGAAHGHGQLHWMLGVLYANGVGVPQSDAMAILHHTFAALESVPEAHMALGHRYAEGIGLPKSCESAVAHYREVADAVAMTYDGVINPISSTKGHIFFHHHHSSSAGIRNKAERQANEDSKMLQVLMYRADGGAADAMVTLGYIYFRGQKGVQRDWNRAKKYFLEAMQKDEALAYGALGQLYAIGDSTANPVIERDLDTAASYFAEGAGRKDATSLNGMGYLHAIGYYENDEPVAETSSKRPDFMTAAKYFEESASRGSAEGMYNFGVLLLYGRGVPQDSSAAIKKFETAASRGSVLSFWQLARHEYMKGNCARALQLYRHVTSFGSMFDSFAESPFPLGHDGSSTPTEPTSIPRTGNQISQLLEVLALAETGHPTSQLNAALLLENAPIIREMEEELQDGVFAKSGRPPEQASKKGAGVLWLEWIYNEEYERLPGSKKGVFEQKSSELDKLKSVEQTEGMKTKGKRLLLSQSEGLNMLRLRMYRLCALSGNSDANLRLGDFYYHGESRLTGVRMSLALLHYEAAAKKHNSKAFFNLGFMYQLGLGVTGNPNYAVSIRDAIYGILTNTRPVQQDQEQEAYEDEVERTRDMAAEEKRLYLAKQYYERVLELDPDGSVYVVRLALTSLNFQWWWLYFSGQRYGLSQSLRLPMPSPFGIGFRPNERMTETSTSESREEETKEEPQHQPSSVDFQEASKEAQHAWQWDDYILMYGVLLLFVLLLLRHHGA